MDRFVCPLSPVFGDFFVVIRLELGIIENWVLMLDSQIEERSDQNNKKKKTIFDSELITLTASVEKLC